MVGTHRVPEALFVEMIAGQRQDLEPVRIADFAALESYCYRVASVVGLASLYVWGFEGGEETLELGVARGVAFQLTNILRDLREDAVRGRCYLPAEEMKRFGVSADAVAQGVDSREFRELMGFQIERAEGFFQESSDLEERIAKDSRPTLRAMTEIYHGLLRKIAEKPERVLHDRISLSTWAKLRIGWTAMRAR
jgi:phytoene synthase